MCVFTDYHIYKYITILYNDQQINRVVSHSGRMTTNNSIKNKLHDNSANTFNIIRDFYICAIHLQYLGY